MIRHWLTLPAVLLLYGTAAAATYYGPTPYLSSADSPFAAVPFGYFYLEDFQDEALNTPGVSVTAGGILSGTPGGTADSVEATPQLRSWYPLANIVRFNFSAAVLGMLPTHAGVVWTDVGYENGVPSGIGQVEFEAFDAFGASLGVLGPFTLGDGSVNGNQAEDRFFGVADPGGISAIELRMPNSIDWELDHLQYGNAIPEPGTFTLFALGAVTAGLWQFRRKVTHRR